jgi:hypothetical protein
LCASRERVALCQLVMVKVEFSQCELPLTFDPAVGVKTTFQDTLFPIDTEYVELAVSRVRSAAVEALVRVLWYS